MGFVTVKELELYQTPDNRCINCFVLNPHYVAIRRDEEMKGCLDETLDDSFDFPKTKDNNTD